MCLRDKHNPFVFTEREYEKNFGCVDDNTAADAAYG